MGAKISILIPAKNESAFITECLNSIIAQSFSDWEALVVNDHSEDDTQSILKEYASKDKRIRVFKNKGSGIIKALRTAYDESKGDFITRMDADDKMRVDKLSVLSKSLDENGIGHLSVGGVHYFAADKVKSGFKNYENWLNQRTLEGSNFDDIFRECTIPSPNWMIHRTDLDNIGAFNSDRYPEDYDLAFRMCLDGIVVIPCDKVTHEWRDYPTRTSRTADHYKDHTFTEIKWYYFDQHFRDLTKQLVIFGTGYRGKKLATHLLNQGVNFQWISHNKEKIGKHIYDVLIEPLETFDWRDKQIIATIAKDEGRRSVNSLAKKNGLKINKDLIHFA